MLLRTSNSSLTKKIYWNKSNRTDDKCLTPNEYQAYHQLSATILIFSTQNRGGMVHPDQPIFDRCFTMIKLWLATGVSWLSIGESDLIKKVHTLTRKTLF